MLLAQAQVVMRLLLLRVLRIVLYHRRIPLRVRWLLTIITPAMPAQLRSTILITTQAML